MAQRTVIIRSTSEGPIQKEAASAAALKPGMLVQPTAASATGAIEALSGTIAPTMRVVIESMDTIISGTYAVGDSVPYVVPGAGDEIFAFSTAPADGTLAVGDLMVSDGSGYLKGLDSAVAIAGYTGEVIAVAMEAKLYVAGVNVQVKVEVL